MKTKFLFPAILFLISTGLIACTGTAEKKAGEILAESKPKTEKTGNKTKKGTKKIAPGKKKEKATTADRNSAEKIEQDNITSSTENSSVRIVLADKVTRYAALNNYSTKYCFMIDMTLPSGQKRFFVYDLEKKSVIYSGLVAHGSCNESFLSRPRFSNSAKSGCTSLGKYKVGEFYNGKYGNSFRLYGLDKTNSNAYNRAVVIHAYDCVTDNEIYPRVLCNSLGCVMVSYNFFDRISRIIDKSKEPIVLWIYG